MSMLYNFLFLCSLISGVFGFFLSDEESDISTHFWLAAIWFLLLGIFLKTCL